MNANVYMIMNNHLRKITNNSPQMVDEVRFISDSFASFINSGEISADDRTIKFSVEQLLFCLQKLSSLPCDKSCCALPCLLDALLALSSYDDKTTATSALEVLWNIGMEPAVALTILCHKNVVCALQKISLFSSGLADISWSILLDTWTWKY